MITNFLTTSIKFLLSGALLLMSMGTAVADDDNKWWRHARVVDCTQPNTSIQRAVNRPSFFRRQRTIFIVGQCEESVLIEVDGTILSGDLRGGGTIGGGVTGEIRVRGAQRVGIEYLHITGPGRGVSVEDGSAVDIVHNEIVGNESSGIGVSHNSFVRVEFNTITGNGRSDPFFEAGIEAFRNGTVFSRGNYIADNGYAAISIGNLAYFRNGLFTAGDPPNPADLDTILQTAAGTVAFDCYRNGTCDVRNADVTGEISVSGLSAFDVRTSTINGNINASSGSRVQLRGSVTGSGLGFVNCFPPEAFAHGAVGCGEPIPGP